VAGGCAFSLPPSRSDYAAIGKGQKSLVLLRVTCEITGEDTGESIQGCITGENASMAIGDFESGGALEPVFLPKMLTAETGKQGWTYFMLEPGIYYIGFQGQRRTDAFTYSARWENVQRYRFDIQPDSPVVYIGSIHFECRSDWFLFGAKYCCFIDNHILKNEEKIAQEIVSDHLKNINYPTTALMQRHTDETLIFRTPRSKR
jgi:hypothetical protein